jgi:hypothetical protein
VTPAPPSDPRLDEIADALNRNTAAIARLSDMTNRLWNTTASYVAALGKVLEAVEMVRKERPRRWWQR